MAPKIERVLGGAGTGKTRLILDRMTAAREELRLSVDQIGFCTFTRAGRQEISERAADAWGVDPEALTRSGWFKTAHAIAHRQCGIGEGQLLEGRDGDEWISRAVGGRVNTTMDARGERTYVAEDGDSTIPLALRAWEMARSTLSDVGRIFARWEICGEQVPDIGDAMAVIEKYERAKTRDSKLDFTDMIAGFAGVKFSKHGPAVCEPTGDVPGDIRVLAIDEAQDSSPLVDRVCRRLAASPSVERIYITGDPYQSIHGFAGGDYTLFLSWEAEESIMPQSYRCPPRVLELGERCLRQMHRGYRDRNIRPAAHDGTVSKSPSIEEAMAGIAADTSALILARCGYALDEYEQILIRREIPYSWVERAGPSSALSGYAALWALQHGETARGEDWASAISQIVVNSKEHGELLVRGEKQAWKKGQRSQIDLIRPTSEDFSLIGATPALESLVRQGNWAEAIEPKGQARAKRWLSAAMRHGAELASSPKVRLSTIHGAKGLEADRVILSSVTSPKVENGRLRLEDVHDEECRIAYVAVTRARRDFVFVEDGWKFKMELPL